MTRVLMVTARYAPDLGGTETHVEEVARRLAARVGTSVTVLSTDRSRTRAVSEVRDGVHLLRVPALPAERDYYFAPGVARVIGQAAARWDVVHVQGIHTLVPVVAMLAALRASIPYVVTFHTGGHSLAHRNAARGVQWRILGPLLRRSSALIGVSEFEAGVVRHAAMLGSRDIHVVRNAGNLPALTPAPSQVPGRIVSVGRIEKYKGHHRVIAALPNVARRLPTAHVVVLGSGPYESELRALAVQMQVQDRVSFRVVPPTDRAAMAAALTEAGAVALLSDYESQGIVIMEALGVGTPVVAFDHTGISDLVRQGWTPGISPRADSTMIADSLYRALTDPRPVPPPDLPTWEDAADRLAAIYRGVLGGSSSDTGGGTVGSS